MRNMWGMGGEGLTHMKPGNFMNGGETESTDAL